jgi:ferric-dicitrate binding protein FerR (iron transport regulator)
MWDRKAGKAQVETIDAGMAMQWTKGKLSFYQASIPEIYRMLERHFNVRIEIGSEELKTEYFLGSINLEMSLSGILSYLDIDKKYRVEVKDDIIIVKNR